MLFPITSDQAADRRQRMKAALAVASFAKKRHSGVLIKIGLPGRSVTIPNDQPSDYGPAQLALFVAAAIVLVFFAWSFLVF